MASLPKKLSLVTRGDIAPGIPCPQWLRLYLEEIQRLLGNAGGLDPSVVDISAQTVNTVADRRHSQLSNVYLVDETNTGKLIESPSTARHVTDDLIARLLETDGGDDQALTWLF